MRAMAFCTATDLIPALPKLPLCSRVRPLSFKSPTFRDYSAIPTNTYRRIGLKYARIAASSMPSAASKAASDAGGKSTKPLSILFVCLGNICRSPGAEGVFRHLVKQRGLESKFHIDSAGVVDENEGKPEDPRMKSAAQNRGIEVNSIARPIGPSDLKDFDVILAMDEGNREGIHSLYESWKHEENLPDDVPNKVRLMCSYCKKHDDTEVPDPYFGGPEGFEKVLDLLEDACGSLLESIEVGKSLV